MRNLKGWLETCCLRPLCFIPLCFAFLWNVLQRHTTQWSLSILLPIYSAWPHSPSWKPSLRLLITNLQNPNEAAAGCLIENWDFFWVIGMGRKKKSDFSVREVVEGLRNFFVQRPLVLAVVPLILVLWVVEKWIFSISSWVPLVVAVWAALQVKFWFLICLCVFCEYQVFVEMSRNL